MERSGKFRSVVFIIGFHHSLNSTHRFWLYEWLTIVAVFR